MKKSITLDHKYNKVNQQQKYHLLNLIYKYKNNVRQAAQTVGINYLTAKTIVFFHKNHYKSYQFAIQPQQHINKYPVTASYANIRKVNPISEQLIKPKSKIQVICSIGNILNPSKLMKPTHEANNLPLLMKDQLEMDNQDCQERKAEEIQLFDKKLQQEGWHTNDILNGVPYDVGNDSLVNMESSQFAIERVLCFRDSLNFDNI